MLGDGRTLDGYIADDPAGALGPAVVTRFGPRLPFLLKILAVEQPLSIQVHPTAAQAVEGYTREDTAGVPPDSPERSYHDRWHKPEMVVALTEFEALLGFEDPARTAALLESCEHPELADAGPVLRAENGLRTVVSRWLTLPDGAAGEVLKALVEEASSRGNEPAFGLIDRLARLYPKDRGLLLALLMCHVRLRPGEAAFVPAGVPHTYLSGVAVEAQASSDNTVRAGLTAKHVDPAEVLRLLRWEPCGAVFVDAVPAGPDELVYPVQDGIEEFRLSRLTPTAEGTAAPGPRILLVMDGAAQVTSAGSVLDVRRGQAAFVPAADADARIHGRGTVFALTSALDTAR